MMNVNGFFYWEYDKATDCLTLCSQTTPKKIRTALKGEMLNQSAFINCDCEVEDFLFYNQIIELIEYSELITPNQQEFIAYTAVAAKSFLLPKQPKSWFFEACEGSVVPSVAQYPCLVQTQIKQTQQTISLLLFDGDDQVADCLLLETALELPGLKLQFGQPLRIFTNRLHYLDQAEYAVDPFWQQQTA
ncbi:cell division protein ZapC domain-containing protein [Testudinibacter sp. P27/CKL/0425]